MGASGGMGYGPGSLSSAVRNRTGTFGWVPGHGRTREEFEVPGFGHRTAPPRLGGAGQVVHLSGRDVVDVETRVVGRPLRERPVKLNHERAEQRVAVALGCAVRVELDEEP